MKTTMGDDATVKGIILAGGTGSRLWPATRSVSKQLLPVYDKPMIYYPLATLMDLGIREFLVIATPRDIDAYRRLLDDGTQWGICVEYAKQDSPRGIAEALVIGEQFIAAGSVALILGDNLFHGADLSSGIRPTIDLPGATVLATDVASPSNYGIVELGEGSTPLSVEEKPTRPKSNLAIPGLYFLDERAPSWARALGPSTRGEIEITDLLRMYLERGELRVVELPADSVWLDAGTVDDLYAATEYVRVIEKRRGVKIGCVEEVAWKNGWLPTEALSQLAELLMPSPYAAYLKSLVSAI